MRRVSDAAARQLIGYIVPGRAVLGAVPAETTIIAERFFDEGGGMQLILHAPFGGRINKAWGLALRKRFCRGFNFELQAAATDNGINISLAEQHSFPLCRRLPVPHRAHRQELLEQASSPRPSSRPAGAGLRGARCNCCGFKREERVAPQIQRTRSEDLLASVFPQAAACFETIVATSDSRPSARREVMQDALQEAMDLEGSSKCCGHRVRCNSLPRRRHARPVAVCT